MSMTIGKEAREALESMWDRFHMGGNAQTFLRDLLNRCTDTPEVGLPEGWVAVPVEPTEEMVASAEPPALHPAAIGIYGSMLRTSPPCPGVVSILDANWIASSEPVAYQYEFTDPVSGNSVWLTTPGPWNLQKPKSSRPLYAHPSAVAGLGEQRVLREFAEWCDESANSTSYPSLVDTYRTGVSLAFNYAKRQRAQANQGADQ